MIDFQKIFQFNYNSNNEKIDIKLIKKMNKLYTTCASNTYKL